MANMIRKQISEEMKAAEHFALQVDEYKDISKNEQIFVGVPYLNNVIVHEEFLHFVLAEGLDTDSLLEKIKHTLCKCNIDKNAYIGQCYDPAAVMSGCNLGVQEVSERSCTISLCTLLCLLSQFSFNWMCFQCANSCWVFCHNSDAIKLFFWISCTWSVHSKTEGTWALKKTSWTEKEKKNLSDTQWACQYVAC